MYNIKLSLKILEGASLIDDCIGLLVHEHFVNIIISVTYGPMEARVTAFFNKCHLEQPDQHFF